MRILLADDQAGVRSALRLLLEQVTDGSPRSYRESGFLTESFIERLDAALEGEGLHFDPLLLAQDLPQGFSVDPGVAPGTAVVHAQFGESSAYHLMVTLVEELGRWKIDRVELPQN